MDLHDFIFKCSRCEENIDDFVFLDGQGVQIDVLNRCNLTILDETTKLCDWHPLLVLALALALALLAFALALAFALVVFALGVGKATALSKAALAHGRGWML